MPGTLSYASPSGVFPQMLCTAFASIDSWPVVGSEYPDGNYQSRVDGVNPRMGWSQTHRLKFAQWTTLAAFWVTKRGGLKPFYFYPNPTQYDPTGNNTTGRYTVRFDGPLSGTYDLPRWVAGLKLIEVA